MERFELFAGKLGSCESSGWNELELLMRENV